MNAALPSTCYRAYPARIVGWNESAAGSVRMPISFSPTAQRARDRNRVDTTMGVGCQLRFPSASRVALRSCLASPGSPALRGHAAPVPGTRRSEGQDVKRPKACQSTFQQPRFRARPAAERILQSYYFIKHWLDAKALALTVSISNMKLYSYSTERFPVLGQGLVCRSPSCEPFVPGCAGRQCRIFWLK